jgi:hypothetical protein
MGVRLHERCEPYSYAVLCVSSGRPTVTRTGLSSRHASCEGPLAMKTPLARSGSRALLLAALVTLGVSVPRPSAAATSYIVEVAHNDELFIINGEKFDAQTYCFNVERGDRVVFLEGSALGACASARFLDLRTEEECAVWCD